MGSLVGYLPKQDELAVEAMAVKYKVSAGMLAVRLGAFLIKYHPELIEQAMAKKGEQPADNTQ